jgi:hypothetical protein
VSDRVPQYEPPRSLDAFLHLAWDELSRAAGSAKHGFHLPVVASVRTDAPLPDARTVVLRQVDRAQRLLIAHTDVRSPKVEQLEKCPEAMWVFYDPSLKLQLRVSGHTRIEIDTPLAQQRWEASNESSRRCYLAPHVPGQPSDEPSVNLPEHVQQRVPSMAETEPGRVNFAAVVTTARTLDVLWLHHAGHYRARYDWKDAGSLDATWLHV